MAKELSINMNTNEIYEFYKSKLIDPKKLKGKSVLILELGNVKYIDEVKKYAKNVCIIDDSYNVFFGDVFVNINTLENQIKTFLEKNKMPKFDIAIMNPPYDKNLHLKILEFMIPKVKLTINISPIRWLQDPLAKYKSSSNYLKFEHSISKHLKSLETIKSNKCDELFGVRFDCDLGIYTLDKNGGFDYVNFNSDKIIDKVRVKWSNANIENNMKNGWRIKIPTINGVSQIHGVKYKDIKPLGEIHIFYNGKKNGKKWHEFWSCNQHSKTTDEITHSVSFNTKDEAQNFADVFETKFGKYVQTKMQTDIHLESYNLLWLNDYTKPWTDKRLCKYFNITGYINDNKALPGSDWELILNTMEEIK
ncbi:MAG: hypothetical protein J6V44_01855 [Methanobrevibacter sp.]|nr:hypothetical protein [Methanobrevibacter sp.]